jgi:hypothetical protein
MLNVTVQYPPHFPDISESDLKLVGAFDGTVAHNFITQFVSALNPEWVADLVSIRLRYVA